MLCLPKEPEGGPLPKKKLLPLALALLLTLAAPAALAEEPELFTAGAYQYALLEDGTAEIRMYSGSAKDLVIPGTLDGRRVTRIGKRAFYGRDSLTAVVIPAGVTTIGSGAFSGCSRLASLTLPDSVTAIADGAFDGCPKLTLHVSRDSWAAQYCRDNGLACAYPDSPDWLNP